MRTPRRASAASPPRRTLAAAALAALWLALLGAGPLDLPRDLRELIASRPPDSLAVPLRRYEADHGRSSAGGQAALLLGHLHYARGEFRAAADDYARAAARLDPAQKPEARYWAGLAWLALGEASQARAALEQVTPGSRRSADAELALAHAWEAAKRPDRALDLLTRLTTGPAREQTPAALERLAILGDQLGRPEIATRARERLQRDYAASFEAARATEPATPPQAIPGAAAVEIGAFESESRAQTLVNTARAAGFSGARLVTLADRPAPHVVRLGVFANAAEAGEAAERATKKLGVAARVVAAP
jgi:tetratricopeptide (TPR) repeat protein